MEIHCTRPGCPRPLTSFADLDDNATLKTVQQKFCTACGMPLILDGRYLPVRLLGQGGFGAAFLARDRRTPAMRQCVVKQFQPSRDLNPQQLAMAQNLFEREAVVLEELGNHHRQIPDLLASFSLEVPRKQGGKHEQFFYLVQEFIDGKNLEEELAAKGKFLEAEVMDVLREILTVLQYVHEHDTIHRDIKPSNIMRDRNGKLYLLDFGAVKQIAQGSGAAGGSSTGIYSMGFAPPEQMAGRSVFPSTDLYALAVTCIMLLTGKEPQDLFDAYTNKWNWREEAQVSDRLGDVLDRLLLPTPSDRFGSAEQVLAALIPKAAPPPLPSSPIPPPSVPVSQATVPAPVSSLTRSFSTLEILAGAGFTGFEGGLLAIAIGNTIKLPLPSTGLWVAILMGLIFAQSRRLIEKVDLLIIAGISLPLILFIPILRAGITQTDVIMFSLVAGLAAIAVTAFFRLIYKLLSNFL